MGPRSATPCDCRDVRSGGPDWTTRTPGQELGHLRAERCRGRPGSRAFPQVWAGVSGHTCRSNRLAHGGRHGQRACPQFEPGLHPSQPSGPTYLSPGQRRPHRSPNPHTNEWFVANDQTKNRSTFLKPPPRQPTRPSLQARGPRLRTKMSMRSLALRLLLEDTKRTHVRISK